MSDSSIFLGGSVLAAVVAGSLALFAPCCISVMLPAYFASSFHNRRVLVAMTFLFAGGVATVVLPIALGAQVLRRLLTTEHTAIFLAAAVLLLGLGLYTLLGGQLHLPMPGQRASTRTGPLGVYSLGLFSGVASSCCAPVLAGVIALSGVASSFGIALGLGAAYVFGMVAPLFLISVLWERYNWRSSRLFRSRIFTWRIGSLRRSITGTGLLSGLLLVLMGLGTLWVAIAFDAMPAASGWQADFAVRLQHYGRIVTDSLSFIPGWAAAVLVLLAIILLARRALTQLREEPRPPDIPRAESGGDPSTTINEEISHEREGV